LASLTAWKNPREGGWYQTAPNEPWKREFLRREKTNEKPAKTETIDITGWTFGSKRFNKNYVPVQRIEMPPLIEYHSSWINNYRRSVKRRQRGEKRRLKNLKLVRFNSEQTMIYPVHGIKAYTNCWHNLLLSQEDIRMVNKIAMKFSGQIAAENQHTFPRDVAIQTNTSFMKKPLVRRKQIVLFRRRATTAAAAAGIKYTPADSEDEPSTPPKENTKSESLKTVDSDDGTETEESNVDEELPKESSTIKKAPPEACKNKQKQNQIATSKQVTRAKRKRSASKQGRNAEALNIQQKQNTTSTQTKHAKSRTARKQQEPTIAPRDGEEYNGNPLFKPVKVQRPENWFHISLVAPKKKLPMGKESWSAADASRFYCSVCDRQYSYTAHSSSQITRHVLRPSHIEKLKEKSKKKERASKKKK
jgi:hypothetical protein